MNEPTIRNGGAPSASPAHADADAVHSAGRRAYAGEFASGVNRGSRAEASVSQLRVLAENLRGGAERSPFLLLLGFGDEEVGKLVEQEILSPSSETAGGQASVEVAQADESIGQSTVRSAAKPGEEPRKGASTGVEAETATDEGSDLRSWFASLEIPEFKLPEFSFSDALAEIERRGEEPARESAVEFEPPKAEAETEAETETETEVKGKAEAKSPFLAAGGAQSLRPKAGEELPVADATSIDAITAEPAGRDQVAETPPAKSPFDIAAEQAFKKRAEERKLKAEQRKRLAEEFRNRKSGRSGESVVEESEELEVAAKPEGGAASEREQGASDESAEGFEADAIGAGEAEFAEKKWVKSPFVVAAERVRRKQEKIAKKAEKAHGLRKGPEVETGLESKESAASRRARIRERSPFEEVAAELRERASAIVPDEGLIEEVANQEEAPLEKSPGDLIVERARERAAARAAAAGGSGGGSASGPGEAPHAEDAVAGPEREVAAEKSSPFAAPRSPEAPVAGSVPVVAKADSRQSEETPPPPRAGSIVGRVTSWLKIGKRKRAEADDRARAETMETAVRPSIFESRVPLVLPEAVPGRKNFERAVSGVPEPAAAPVAEREEIFPSVDAVPEPVVAAEQEVSAAVAAEAGQVVESAVEAPVEEAVADVAEEKMAPAGPGEISKTQEALGEVEASPEATRSAVPEAPAKAPRRVVPVVNEEGAFDVTALFGAPPPPEPEPAADEPSLAAPEEAPAKAPGVKAVEVEVREAAEPPVEALNREEPEPVSGEESEVVAGGDGDSTGAPVVEFEAVAGPAENAVVDMPVPEAVAVDFEDSSPRISEAETDVEPEPESELEWEPEAELERVVKPEPALEVVPPLRSEASVTSDGRIVAPCPMCSHLLNVNTSMIGMVGNCPSCVTAIVAAEIREEGESLLIVEVVPANEPAPPPSEVAVPAPPSSVSARETPCPERELGLGEMMARSPLIDREATAHGTGSRGVAAPEPRMIDSPKRDRLESAASSATGGPVEEPSPIEAQAQLAVETTVAEYGDDPALGRKLYSPPPAPPGLTSFGPEVRFQERSRMRRRNSTGVLVVGGLTLGAFLMAAYFAWKSAQDSSPRIDSAPVTGEVRIPGQGAAAVEAAPGGPEGVAAAAVEREKPAAAASSAVPAKEEEKKASPDKAGNVNGYGPKPGPDGNVAPSRAVEPAEKVVGLAEGAGGLPAMRVSKPGLELNAPEFTVGSTHLHTGPSLAEPSPGLPGNGAEQGPATGSAAGPAERANPDAAGNADVATRDSTAGFPKEKEKPDASAPGEDLSHLVEEERMGILAERTLLAFLNAGDLSTRMDLVVPGENVLAEMEAYYRKHELTPFQGVVNLEGILKDVSTGLWVSAFNLWEPGSDGYLLVYVIGNDERGRRVDWSWYRQVRSEGLKKYFEGPQEVPMVVRAVLRRTHYYGSLEPGDPEPVGIRVETPFTQSFTGSVFLDPLSVPAKQLVRDLKWGQERMATIELSWVGDDRYEMGNRVVVEEFYGWGLALDRLFQD